MKIVVIDGQGGRMGRLVVEKILSLVQDHELLVIGTNSIATAAMLKAGAVCAATGENPILVNVPDADIIIGPIGIVLANALYGEVTKKMAVAVASSPAKKILIPVSKCHQVIVGVTNLPLSKYMDMIYEEVKKTIDGQDRS